MGAFHHWLQQEAACASTARPYSIPASGPTSGKVSVCLVFSMLVSDIESKANKSEFLSSYSKALPTPRLDWKRSFFSWYCRQIPGGIFWFSSRKNNHQTSKVSNLWANWDKPRWTCGCQAACLHYPITRPKWLLARIDKIPEEAAFLRFLGSTSTYSANLFSWIPFPWNDDDDLLYVQIYSLTILHLWIFFWKHPCVHRSVTFQQLCQWTERLWFLLFWNSGLSNIRSHICCPALSLRFSWF